MLDGNSNSKGGGEEGVAANIVWELEDFIRGLGVDLPVQIPMPEPDPEDPGGLGTHVSYQDFYRLCEAALGDAPEDGLGLRWGQDISGHMLGVIPSLIRHAKTLRHALENLTRFAGVVRMEQHLQLFERGDEAFLQLRAVSGEPPSEPVRRMLTELSLVGIYRIIDKYCPGPKVLRVLFDYPQPSYVQAYTAIFGERQEFGHPHAGIILDRALLDTPSRHRDHLLFEAAQALAEQRSAEVASDLTFASRVFNVLTRSQAPQHMSMNEVAHELGMSARSLQRRLSDEGTSFTAETHRASGVVARQLMLRGCSIKEAAGIMGFVDPSSFSRAFKRWTGVAPGQVCRR